MARASVGIRRRHRGCPSRCAGAPRRSGLSYRRQAATVFSYTAVRYASPTVVLQTLPAQNLPQHRVHSRVNVACTLHRLFCLVLPCSAFCIMLSFALLVTKRTPRGCCSICGPHGAQRSLWNEGLTRMHACRPEAPAPSRCRSYPDAGRGQGPSPWRHAARRSAVSCPAGAVNQGCTDVGCHMHTGAPTPRGATALAQRCAGRT